MLTFSLLVQNRSWCRTFVWNMGVVHLWRSVSKKINSRRFLPPYRANIKNNDYITRIFFDLLSGPKRGQNLSPQVFLEIMFVFWCFFEGLYHFQHRFNGINRVFLFSIIPEALQDHLANTVNTENRLSSLESKGKASQHRGFPFALGNFCTDPITLMRLLGRS